MARVARRLGVEIRLNEPVEEILFSGKRAVGVRTKKGNMHGEAVVVNADFARAMHRLVPDKLRRRWTEKKIAKKKFSCSTFMMYLGIDGQYDLPHHLIHIAKDYVKNLDDIENKHVLSDDPSFYVQNASVTDPTLAPKGQSTLYVLSPVTHKTENVNRDKEKERYRALLFKQLAKAGYTDVEKRIRYEKVITPTDWEGTVADQMNITADQANLLVLDTNGKMTFSIHGAATQENLKKLERAVRATVEAGKRPDQSQLQQSSLND